MPSSYRTGIKYNKYMQKTGGERTKGASKAARSIAVARSRQAAIATLKRPIFANAPSKMVVKHVYESGNKCTLGGGISGSETTVPYTYVNSNSVFDYDANCMYDPNGVLGGHQPTNFDRMCALYNKYKVIKSKITVKFVFACNGIADAIAPLNVCVACLDRTKRDDFIGKDSMSIAENADIVNRKITSDNCKYGAGRLNKLTKWYYPKKVLGDVTDTEITCLSSAVAVDVPVRAQWYITWLQDTFHRAGVATNEWNSGGLMIFTAKIEYWAEWSGPKLESLN